MTSKLLKFWFHIAIILLIGKDSLIHADSGLSPFVQDVIEKKGTSIKELKENHDLRKEWLKQLRSRRSQETSDEQFEALQRSDYYGIIVANNIFRPLGYRKPKKQQPFKLIATIIAHETGKNRNMALIQSTKNHLLYYIREGDEFANAKLQRVEPRRVTLLYDGKSQDFQIASIGFLNNVNRSRRKAAKLPSGGARKAPPIFSERMPENFFNPDMRQTIEIDMSKVSPEERAEIIRKAKEELRKRPSGSELVITTYH